MPRQILVAVRDLLFGSKIQAAAQRTGTAVQWASRFEPLSQVVAQRSPDVLIVDLAQPGAIDELSAIRSSGRPLHIVGYCGHTSESVLAEAEQLGVDEVMSNGTFHRKLDEILLRVREG